MVLNYIINICIMFRIEYLQHKGNYVTNRFIRPICRAWIFPLSKVYILVVLILEWPKMSASLEISFSRE